MEVVNNRTANNIGNLGHLYITSPVDTKVHRFKGINTLHFNALNNTHRLLDKQLNNTIFEEVYDEDIVKVRGNDNRENGDSLDSENIDNERLLNDNKQVQIVNKSNKAKNGNVVVKINGIVCDNEYNFNSDKDEKVLNEQKQFGAVNRPKHLDLKRPASDISDQHYRVKRVPTGTNHIQGMVDSVQYPSKSPLPTNHYVHNKLLTAKSVDNGTVSSLVTSPSSLSPSIKTGSFIYSDSSSLFSYPRISSDVMSVRSLASIGMGSTDGKRLVIRRVPTSPTELLNIVNPPTPPEDDIGDGGSSFFGGMGAASDDDTDSIYLKPRRQQWASKAQFVLACVGYSVGLGNVWRFPYLCYKSGGGVFLVPYFLILVICGIPMLYMELAVGQFTGRGPIGALGHLCPIFKGAGLASVVISFLMSTYYSVIIAYSIYYFFTSFRTNIPWSNCKNRWNTEECWVSSTSDNITRPLLSRTPSEEFFDKKVLQITNGIEDPGVLRWDLVACLLCAWVFVYFAIWKSIKSSAKVRYFTATLPFFLIIMFLARSVTLDGAERGLRYFFKPRWELISDARVWVNAAAQNFNSLGIGFGSMISFASYNRYNNNILYDALAVSLINVVTCLLVGIFTFATIGNIATELNTSIENVIDDGPGLVFVVYPQALAKMPATHFWAVLFFFMMLCLGLNSQFAIVEVVVTSIQDGFPKWVKKNLLCHEMLVLVVCVVSFLFGLPNVIQGGMYFFQLIDHYTASISIMYLAFFEVIAISWFYGAWRLSANVKDMTGRPPSLYFRLCWLIFAPLLLFSLWIFVLIDYTPPSYNNGKYKYPQWAIAIGWFIASLSIICIPAFAIYVLFNSNGTTLKEKLKSAFHSDIYDCKVCGENNCEHLEKNPEELAELSPMIPYKVIQQGDVQNKQVPNGSTSIKKVENPPTG